MKRQLVDKRGRDTRKGERTRNNKKLTENHDSL